MTLSLPLEKRRFPARVERQTAELIVLLFDAAGLGLFAVAGTQKALAVVNLVTAPARRRGGDTPTA